MSGLFSKARSLASTVKVPSMSTLFAAKNKANTNALSNALKKYINSVRKVRTQNPFGVSHASLLNATKNNRANVNAKLQNYIMKVNKAKYMNAVANSALKNPTIPETTTAQLVNAAAAANTSAASATDNAKLTALITLLNSYNGKNNTWYSNQNLNTLTSQLNNASRNVTLNNNSRERLKIVRNRIRAAQTSKSPQTRAESVVQQSRTNQTQNTKNNIERSIQAPNGRNIIVTRRGNNKEARWIIKNEKNREMYNLNNRNKNIPTIRNVNLNGSALFNQGN
jgi:hypothetical protein